MAQKTELQDAIDKLDNGEFDSNSWSVIKKILSSNGDKSWTAEEQQELLDKFHEWANSSPEAQKELRSHLRDTATQRFTKQYKPFFNAILQGADIATSIGQINTSNNALKALIPPSIASSPGEPQALKAQLANAQQGGMAAARAIAPAQQQIEQQYQTDINNAKNVSGGNAGNFMANAQVASLAKQKAAAQLPMIEDTIQNRYQSRADQIAGQLGSLAQQDYGNRLFGSQLAQQQYQQQAAAYGHLGSTGRLNLRNTLQGIPDTLTGIFGQAAPVGYNPIKQAQSPLVKPNEYGKYSSYAEAVKGALRVPKSSEAWNAPNVGINPYNLQYNEPISYLPTR